MGTDPLAMVKEDILMKKILSVLLMLAIVLGLCACGGTGESASTEPEAPKGLQIGYGRESIMPQGQVNMSGSGNTYCAAKSDA